jgi:hypothetical protein
MKGTEMNKLMMLAAIAVASACCQKNEAPAPAEPAETAPAKIAVATPTAANQVAKIVFIDQEESCECTEKRIAASWAALTEVLGAPPRLPVERIHLDIEDAKADIYDAMKPLVVPPGIYFLDEKEALVEMLQGEVKAEQIQKVLKGGK